MKYNANLIKFLAIILIYSCERKPIKSSSKEKVAAKVEKLVNIEIIPSNHDSLLHVWKMLAKQQIIASDTLLYTKVAYQIGMLYGMVGNDSAQFYLEHAWARIEPSSGNLKEKALVCNGLGNIWNAKSKDHKANFYYNKAGTIILANPAIDLTPAAKSIMLLAAAQSNTQLFQYDLASQMNKAALALVDQLPETHPNRQRALVQTIQLLNEQNKSSDTIRAYLVQLEKLHQQSPNAYDVAFLYECKAKSFERTGPIDSLIRYQQLKCHIDSLHLQQIPNKKVYLNNLFISYTNLAGSYVIKGQFLAAQRIFDLAKKLLKRQPELINKNLLIIYQNNLATLFDLQGNGHQAAQLMFHTYELQKANYQSENTQAVAEMNTLYQLQAKDRSIQKLNEDIKINQLQFEQNQLLLIISVLIIILLGGILSLFVYGYRARKAQQSKEKILLQQQLLRTQMEPHFIFNTLSAVQSFIRLDKKEAAISYLNRFSRLLRSSLELSRENLVPLKEEIETLQNYLSLQQMRYDEAFSYEMHIPDSQLLDGILIPPMLIQPHVENAILHGVDLAKRNGKIDIYFHIQADILQIQISDSGKSQKNEYESRHRSMAGTICRERLKLLGKKANIQLSSSIDGGTMIKLSIPIN